MKKTLISLTVLVLLANSGACYSQSIEETLKYINAKILEHQFQFYLSNFETGEKRNGIVFPDTRTLAKDLEASMNRETWSIDGAGLLTILRKKETFFIPSGTKYPDWLSASFQSRGCVTTEKREVFLKSLDLEVHVNDYRSDIIGVSFRCKSSSSSCISSSIMPGFQRLETDYTHSIDIDNLIEANKLANAIRHLIALANQKTEYLEKDPFAK